MRNAVLITACACLASPPAFGTPLPTETHGGKTFFALSTTIKHGRDLNDIVLTHQTEVHHGLTFTTWGVTLKGPRYTMDQKIANCLQVHDTEICDEFADMYVPSEEIPMDILPDEILIVPERIITAQTAE